MNEDAKEQEEVIEEEKQYDNIQLPNNQRQEDMEMVFSKEELKAEKAKMYA